MIAIRADQGENRAVAETYYSERSRRDPGWRLQQLAEAKEREARRRELDPEGFRAKRRAATRRTRERQAEAGLTFDQLARRSEAEPGSLKREWLAWVLRDELRRGRIDYHSSSRRYILNGGIPAAS